MDSNYIYEARKYKNEKQWKKAIENFEKQKNQNLEIGVEDSLIYAHCLFMDGQIGRAKNVLLSVLKKNNKYEEALYQLLIIYDNQSAWNEAFDIIKQLLTIDSSNPDYYFYMGRINSYLRNNEEAKNNYINGLLFKHDTNYEELVEMIQKECFPDYEGIDSSYVFMGGKNNLGAFVHKVNNEEFITKITKIGNGSKKETTFYEEVVSLFPQVQDAVPRFISSINKNDINYLTIEKIEFNNSACSFDDVVKASQLVSSIPYKSINRKFPNSNYNYRLKNRANFITPYFTNIHKKVYNNKLFNNLKKFSEQRGDSQVIQDIILYLEHEIMDNELFLYINPDKHYSLLHGDFQPSNILFDKKSEKIKIIDWPTFKVGPKFIDLTRYFQASLTSFKDIQSYYLNNDEVNKLELIEKVFFLYSFILFHFLILNKHNVYSNLNHFIIPALIEMNKLIKECLGSSYIEHIDFLNDIITDFNTLVIEENSKLSIHNRELKKDNKRIKKDIKTLVEENKRTKNKLQRILNSKSWKLTSPFRKLINKIKR